MYKSEVVENSCIVYIVNRYIITTGKWEENYAFAVQPLTLKTKGKL